MDGDRDRLLSSGFDGYLEKPISVHDFATEVRRHLHEAQRRR
jgi:two-component system cell cycle response regulator DivK